MKLNNREIELLKNETQELMQQCRFSEAEIERFLSLTDDCLKAYTDSLGENAEVKCTLKKTFGKVVLKLSASGKSSSELRTISEMSCNGNLLNGIMFPQTSSVLYKHSLDSNLVIISSPVADRNSGFLRNPMVWAVILGLVSGFLLNQLPDKAVEIINQDVITPVLSLVLAMISGIMGPVVFLSLTSAISSLDSIKQLSDLGRSVFRRSFYMTIFVSSVSLIIAALLLVDFSVGGADFKPSNIVEMLLSVLPTNLITPFTENNLSQIVILGFAVGSAFLILGERVSGLSSGIRQASSVINQVMEFVLKLIPVIPFLSLINVILSGNSKTLLASWKYIVAIYIAYIVILLVKLIKVSIRCKVSIPKLLIKSKDATMVSFLASSVSASLQARYEVGINNFGIDSTFAHLWIPMSQALYFPTAPIALIMAPCMAASYENVPLTTSLLLVLMILVIQMSIASPGTIAAWTILLQQLSLPAQYVGIFSTCRILTGNANAFCLVQYCMLEEIELAYIKGKIDLDKLRS